MSAKRHYLLFLRNDKISSSIKGTLDSFISLQKRKRAAHSSNKMHILHIFFIFSFFSVTLANNSCVFEHPVHGVINITSIGLRNNQPRFRDLSSSLSPYYTYSFNPCFSFIENNCRNVAVCQGRHKKNYTFIR